MPIFNLVIQDFSCPPPHPLSTVIITDRVEIGNALEPPFQPTVGTKSCTPPASTSLLAPAITSLINPC